MRSTVQEPVTRARGRRGVGALAGALLALTGLTAAQPASASTTAESYSCDSGMNTATTGWATCWGGPVTFRLVLNCYYYPQVVTDWWYQSSGSHTLYASCPGWSHITATYYQVEG